MKRVKRLIGLTLGIVAAVSLTLFSVCATDAPEVTFLLPQTLKIGDSLTEEEHMLAATGKNLPQGYFGVDFDGFYLAAFGSHAGDGPVAVKPDGTGEAYLFAHKVYVPGNYDFQASIMRFNEETKEYEEIEKIGKPYCVTVEEPVIETNEPTVLRKGDSIVLTAELTNTSLKNGKVQTYKDEIRRQLEESGVFSIHEPIYEPAFEIIEGAALVEREDGDFSNTLTASEKLTFTGTGTVKIRVIFQQLMSCNGCNQYINNGTPELENGEIQLYSPEKTITLQVLNPDNAQGIDSEQTISDSANTSSCSSGQDDSESGSTKTGMVDVLFIFLSLAAASTAVVVLMHKRRNHNL